MDSQWIYYCLSVDFLWISYGSPLDFVDFLCVFYGLPMDSLMVSNELIVDVLWVHYGFPMNSL